MRQHHLAGALQQLATFFKIHAQRTDQEEVITVQLSSARRKREFPAVGKRFGPDSRGHGQGRRRSPRGFRVMKKMLQKGKVVRWEKWRQAAEYTGRKEICPLWWL